AADAGLPRSRRGVGLGARRRRNPRPRARVPPHLLLGGGGRRAGLALARRGCRGERRRGRRQRPRVLPAPALGWPRRGAAAVRQRVPGEAGRTVIAADAAFAPSEEQLRWHGDRDATAGLCDLAVNVRAGMP